MPWHVSERSTPQITSLSNVPTPLQITFETLTKSRNEAAVPTLVSTLGHDDRAIHSATMLALMKRRNKAGHLAVLRQWHRLPLDQRKLLQEGRSHINAALRDAVVSDDLQLFTNGCEVIEQFTEIDLVPALINVAENKNSPHADQATQVVSRLIERLSDMLRGPRDSQDRRDPTLMQRHVLESLERSVERFRQHKRSELIEAFVVVAGASSSLLQSLLDAPHHACFQTVLDTITESKSLGVHQLLLDFLNESDAPRLVLLVISRRTDKAFVTRLLALADKGFTQSARKNLKQIQSFTWLDAKGAAIISFDAEDQRRAVELISVSGICRESSLDILESVLHGGADAGRLAVCKALASLQGDRPNRLIQRALDDCNPAVQAEATRQLRERHIPGAMTKLVELLDSAYDEVRDAAREALGEFTFENYLSRYGTLTEEVRRSTGSLVCKVDPQAVSLLAHELESPSRSRRLRAIEIVETLGLVSQVSGALIERLQDEDHLIRAATADVLHCCDRADVRAALEEAVEDRSSAVQNAARSSLESIAASTAAMSG